MRLALVGYHPPEPEGTPTGRCYWALGEGLRALGHDVVGWSWGRPPMTRGLADWCEPRVLPDGTRWKVKARALVRPRYDVERAHLPVPTDRVAVADEPLSWAAVADAPMSAVTFHFLTRLDAAALGRRSARDVQDRRHEWLTARRAPVVHAYSSRVAAIAAQRAHVVPIAIPVPDQPVPTVDRPVALLLANWAWPPNRPALERVLRLWREVRDRMPHAELLLAGWGSEAFAENVADGIRVLGPVERVADAFCEAAVLAFPCPSSSGPKVKVLEALAHGLPVVTTAAGAEGVTPRAGDGAGGAVLEAHDDAAFVAALTRTLGDAALRAELGRRGRAAVVDEHGPLAAAKARVASLQRSYPDAP